MRSGNRYLQQILERLLIPLYALFMIRQSCNLEGILETTEDCKIQQDRILAAYDQKEFNEGLSRHSIPYRIFNLTNSLHNVHCCGSE